MEEERDAEGGEGEKETRSSMEKWKSLCLLTLAIFISLFALLASFV